MRVVGNGIGVAVRAVSMLSWEGRGWEGEMSVPVRCDGNAYVGALHLAPEVGGIAPSLYSVPFGGCSTDNEGGVAGHVTKELERGGHRGKLGDLGWVEGVVGLEEGGDAGREGAGLTGGA